MYTWDLKYIIKALYTAYESILMVQIMASNQEIERYKKLPSTERTQMNLAINVLTYLPPVLPSCIDVEYTCYVACKLSFQTQQTRSCIVK